MTSLAERLRNAESLRWFHASAIADELDALTAQRDELEAVIARIAHFPNRKESPAQDARDMQSIARAALATHREPKP